MDSKTAVAIAHPNIAFIKYWGNQDQDLRIPMNSSLSMNLSNLTTKTKVTFHSDQTKDHLTINQSSTSEEAHSRVSQLLDRIRNLAPGIGYAQVESENNFPTGSGIASSESLWASILAGEANVPGTYSKRTVNFLNDLDKKDAELFQTLCRFGWIIGGFTPLIFAHQDQIYSGLGLNFDTLTHLESIGLIQYDHSLDFHLKEIPKSLIVSYFGQPLSLTMENDSNNQLVIGRFLLTRVGRELATVCEVQEVDGFYNYVKTKWAKYISKDGNAETGQSS